MSKDYQPLAGVLTEDEVIDFLGVTKNQLTAMRHKSLPFIRINARARLYFEDDLKEFFVSVRTILNKDVGTI